MKNSICVILALASLTSLSACSGQTSPMAPSAPLTAPQNLTQAQPVAPGSASFSQVTQQTQQHSSEQPASPELIPGSRSYSKSVFDKPSTVKSNGQPEASKPTVPVKTTVAAKPTVPQVSASQELITKAVERFKTLESFKIYVDGFETVIGKSPSRLSFNMFALNGKAKIEVTKHTNSLYVGVKMGYQSGTDAISVRAGGLLGILKIDTKMSDERLSTPRGYRLDQIDAFALSKRLLDGPHVPKVLGKTQINGRSIAILEYTNANDYDPRITRELLGIDMEDHFVRTHEMYEGTTLVFSLKLSNIQLNAPVTAAELAV
jgi:hypothetical protein